MSIEKIMSVSGQPGLFRLITQTKAGFVVESVTDKKRLVVNASQRVSMLKDITIYTTGEDKLLREILNAIREKHPGELPVSPKSDPDALKQFFRTVVPDYDEEKVYVSDIKKIVAWHALLRDIPLEEEKEQDDDAAKKPATDSPEPNDETAPAPEAKK